MEHFTKEELKYVRETVCHDDVEWGLFKMGLLAVILRYKMSTQGEVLTVQEDSRCYQNDEDLRPSLPVEDFTVDLEEVPGVGKVPYLNFHIAA